MQIGDLLDMGNSDAVDWLINHQNEYKLVPEEEYVKLKRARDDLIAEVIALNLAGWCEEAERGIFAANGMFPKCTSPAVTGEEEVAPRQIKDLPECINTDVHLIVSQEGCGKSSMSLGEIADDVAQLATEKLNLDKKTRNLEYMVSMLGEPIEETEDYIIFSNDGCMLTLHWLQGYYNAGFDYVMHDGGAVLFKKM